MCGGVRAWLLNIRGLMDTRASGAIFVPPEYSELFTAVVFKHKNTIIRRLYQQEIQMDIVTSILAN